MKNLKTATIPRLYNAAGNTEKNWFIHYRVLHPSSMKMERVKIYRGLSKDLSEEERTKNAQKLISELSAKLAAGWNPFEDTEHFYYKKVPNAYGRTKATLGEVFYQFYFAQPDHLRVKSKTTYKSVFRNFLIWAEKTGYHKLQLVHFNRQHAEAFLKYLVEEKKLSPTSRNKHWAILKPVFEQFVQDKRIEENPLNSIVKLKEHRQGKLAFKKFQVDLLRELFQKHDPQLWLFCQFQYYCFIRPGELRNLKIENLDFDQAMIYIPGTISKNKKSQYVVIPEPFYKTLIACGIQNNSPEAYIFTPFEFPGQIQVSRDYFNKRHAKLLKSVGMDKRHSLYSWKHTGNVMAARSGINIKELQMQNRHADLETFDIYLKSMGVEDMTMLREQFPGI